MKKPIKILSIFISIFLFNSCSNQDENLYGHLDTYQAIVCLTYDDGMKTQYENAIPHLNEAGLKGTFFINNVSNRDAVAAWRNASEAGHELGNHTLFHPCPISHGWIKEVTTDYYTVDLILDEIKTVNSILDITELKSKKRPFAYPCNNMFIGENSYKEDLKKSNLVTFARTGNPEKIVIDRFEKTLDPMWVPSWSVPEDTNYSELKNYVDQAIQKKGIGIFQFHGIGGEWLSISKEDHLQLVEYLKEKKETVAILTFTEVMNFLESKK